MNKNAKNFFKEMKQEFKEYSEDITEGFPYFCLKIFWDSLSQDEIEEALTGLGSNDDSIDAFFIDEENREINILQCKSSESEKAMTSLKKEWLAYLQAVTDKLRDSEYINKHKNERLKEIAEQFLIYEKKGFKPKLHFFHLGYVGNKSVLNHHKPIVYYDFDRIKDEFLEFDSKRDRTEPRQIDISLPYLDNIEVSLNKQNKTFISIITGDELVNLRENYRYKLFDKNLRFSLGKNKINKEITNTCVNKPDSFYFFNNGITITSKGFKYQPTNNKLKIECPQIINGAQTVNAIYEAYKKQKNKLSREKGKDATQITKEQFKRIKVLFRIIQDHSKDGKKTSDFEKNVIKYNNTQNIIKETDFFSNNIEQIKLQESFAKFGFFYEIKRGDRKFLDKDPENEHNLLKKKKSDFKYWDEKFDMEKLASIWMAYSRDPKLDKIKKSYIFGSGQEDYNRMFHEEEISDEKTKEMILAYHLYELISTHTDIFDNKKKNGELISKLSKVEENKDSYGNWKEGDLFKNIQDIVQNSLIFNEMIKQEFKTKENFLKKREPVIKRIQSYQFFSMGKYLTLSIFKLILDECNYLESLFKHNLFSKKDFIKKNIVSPWLLTVLDKLMKEEYKEFKQKFVGSGLKTFYSRTQTVENIKEKFKDLTYQENKDFKEIFPLNI